jgi:hypothetical protein
MAEQPTTPEGAVEQGPPSAESLEGILENQFGDTPEPKPPKEQPAEQETAADDDGQELTADDLADEEDAAPQSAPGVEFEIVHNGQQHRLSREETIKLAQQGFDYTQKTQRLSDQQKQVDAVMQRAAEIEQMIPHVGQELATVKALEAQLSQYANVDWVRLATEDPLDYPKHRAQYDQLMQGYSQARGQLQQKAAYLHQTKQTLTQQSLQQEAAKLVERIPEWRDPAKYQAGAKELQSYLLKQGADPGVIDTLSDSLAVTIARKAMLYDKLVAAKSERSKQVRTAPPVVRPGAAVQGDQSKTIFAKARVEMVKAGKQGNSGKQERLMEALLGRTFKK